MSISTVCIKSEIVFRTGMAARVFLPPLALVIGCSLLLVIISLAHPFSLRIGNYQLPIFMPYAEQITKILCYVVVYAGFCSLFISATVRHHVIQFFQKRSRLKNPVPSRSSSSASLSKGSDRPRSQAEIRMGWERVQIERRLRDFHDDQQKRLGPDAEPITDFEAFEILVPMLCAVILLLLLLWPIVLIVTLLTVTILALRGTLRLVLARIVDFVFRGAFRL